MAKKKTKAKKAAKRTRVESTKPKKTAAKKAKKKRKKGRITPKILTPDQEVWREPNGYFKKGNPGGPGRPFLRQERFLRAINDEVTPARWTKVIKQALTDAEAGDRHAREWLSKYLIGSAEAIPVDERRTIIDVLTDTSFVKWIETEKPKI